VVTVVTSWMLDPVSCAGMEIGAPRHGVAPVRPGNAGIFTVEHPGDYATSGHSVRCQTEKLHLASCADFRGQLSSPLALPAVYEGVTVVFDPWN
jgi:hypothetical protein